MTKAPYEAMCIGGNWRVVGPGDGLSFHSQVLWPELSCKDEEEAKRAAAIATIAFKAGRYTAKSEVRRALGFDSTGHLLKE